MAVAGWDSDEEVPKELKQILRINLGNEVTIDFFRYQLEQAQRELIGAEQGENEQDSKYIARLDKLRGAVTHWHDLITFCQLQMEATGNV